DSLIGLNNRCPTPPQNRNIDLTGERRGSRDPAFTGFAPGLLPPRSPVRRMTCSQAKNSRGANGRNGKCCTLRLQIVDKLCNISTFDTSNATPIARACPSNKLYRELWRKLSSEMANSP